MAISNNDGSATIGATEFSLPANANYASGSPQTADAMVQGWLDCSNIAAGDLYQVRVYEKVNVGSVGGTAGTQQIVFEAFPPPGTKLMAFPALILTDGWDFSVKKISGTDRVFIWSIRSVT